MESDEKNEVYIIPQNFIDTGTLFGGTLKIRNAIEAGLLGFLLGYLVLQLKITLYYKIIVCCLTVLPLTLLTISN